MPHFQFSVELLNIPKPPPKKKSFFLHENTVVRLTILGGIKVIFGPGCKYVTIYSANELWNWKTRPFVSFINVSNATLTQFRCVRKIFPAATTSFVVSVGPHRTTRLPTGRIFVKFSIIVLRESPSFVKKTDKENNGYLTLRRLMSYIYIYIYMEHPFLMFLDHTQRRSTVGRTPLDE